jgi:ribonucleoside-diphosphate reductase alpha chain
MSRDVGLGLMGFHSYLQSKNIPIDSAIAKGINFKMFQSLASKTNAASLLLGSERGEPEDMKGTGHRFGHKMAIAPNATSSIICGGVSPACETIPANIFTHKTKTGSFEVKNSLLETLLASKGKNTGEVWTSILENKGSVQHLDFLSDQEKSVFKTSQEVDQMYQVDLTADRTPFICQSQSFNIYVPADISVAEMHVIHFASWKKGVKTMYYCRSQARRRAENVLADIDVKQLSFTSSDYDGCRSCEG